MLFLAVELTDADATSLLLYLCEAICLVLRFDFEVENHVVRAPDFIHVAPQVSPFLVLNNLYHLFIQLAQLATQTHLQELRLQLLLPLVVCYQFGQE